MPDGTMDCRNTLHVEQHQIRSGDGWQLGATVYRARSAQRVAIILPATGADQSRYAAFARFLATEGWLVVTFDYRGIGRSCAIAGAGQRVSMQAWGEEDLAAVIDWVTVNYAPGRLVAIGHSIGGQIVPLADNCERIDALLAVAAQKGHWRLWSAPRSLLVYGFFKFYIPLCLFLFGHVPMPLGGLHRLDAQVGRDYARWTLRLPYQGAQGEPLTARFARFRAPILALSFADDLLYAPRRAVDFLMRHYFINAPVWRVHMEPTQAGLAGLGHSGFFDPARASMPQWKEASDWLDWASSGRPVSTFPIRALGKATALTNQHPLATDERAMRSQVRRASA